MPDDLPDRRPETYEHIRQVNAYLLRVSINLLTRGLMHDRSKLESPEREAFDVMTDRLSRVEYGSDAYKACLEEMQPTLRHHYAHNAHHPEHWENGVWDMSLLDVLEMLCDWMAASKRTKDGDIMRSIAVNRERFGYDGLLESLLRNTVSALE